MSSKLGRIIRLLSKAKAKAAKPAPKKAAPKKAKEPKAKEAKEEQNLHAPLQRGAFYFEKEKQWEKERKE